MRVMWLLCRTLFCQGVIQDMENKEITYHKCFNWVTNIYRIK